MDRIGIPRVHLWLIRLAWRPGNDISCPKAIALPSNADSHWTLPPVADPARPGGPGARVFSHSSRRPRKMLRARIIAKPPSQWTGGPSSCDGSGRCRTSGEAGRGTSGRSGVHGCRLRARRRGGSWRDRQAFKQRFPPTRLYHHELRSGRAPGRGLRNDGTDAAVPRLRCADGAPRGHRTPLLRPGDSAPRRPIAHTPGTRARIIAHSRGMDGASERSRCRYARASATTSAACRGQNRSSRQDRAP